nr:hypothetical protein [Microbacterium bovistercoris]
MPGIRAGTCEGGAGDLLYGDGRNRRGWHLAVRYVRRVMAYSDVEKYASAANASAMQAQYASGDEATKKTAEAVGYLGLALNELAGVLRRSER